MKENSENKNGEASLNDFWLPLQRTTTCTWTPLHPSYVKQGENVSQCANYKELKTTAGKNKQATLAFILASSA